MSANPQVSIIIPCLNEHEPVAILLDKLEATLPGAEIVLVDDGSNPPLPDRPGIHLLRHPTNLGNGAAIKTGARNATGEILVFMDSDGQHDPKDIQRLLDKMAEGYDLVVGARDSGSQASFHRRIANGFYNWLASVMVGHQIDDLTSGFRAARARYFRNFIYLLPNGFSYPTTSTMAFFRNGHAVAYIPIKAHKRTGKSKIRLLRDGLKFLLIITKIGALFSPMRFFAPIAGVLFALASVHYLTTYVTAGRFTNMSAVLYLASLSTLLIGVVSEQISALHYRFSEERRRASDYAVRSSTEDPAKARLAPSDATAKEVASSG